MKRKTIRFKLLVSYLLGMAIIKNSSLHVTAPCQIFSDLSAALFIFPGIYMSCGMLHSFWRWYKGDSDKTDENSTAS